jgi:hypothetical protein
MNIEATAIPTDIWEALSEFQRRCPPIGFDNEGQVGTRTYGYATLPAILRKTRPLLRDLGLLVTQRAMGRSIETTVVHLETGERITSSLELTDVADMQKLGSAVTYGRRYDYCLLLGIAPDEDDDGAATVEKPETASAVEVRKSSAAANQERTAPAAFVAPEGWDSDEARRARHHRRGSRSRDDGRC